MAGGILRWNRTDIIISDESLWKIPPLVFQRSETRGGIVLRESKCGRNLTNFLVVLQFVSQKFSRLRRCFQQFRVFLIDP